MGCLGLETPRSKRAMRPKPTGICRLRTRQSPDVTVVASVLIRTSLSLGVGFASSFNSTTSGGPYRSYTIAFIRRPPRLLYSLILAQAWTGTRHPGQDVFSTWANLSCGFQQVE